MMINVLIIFLKLYFVLLNTKFYIIETKEKIKIKSNQEKSEGKQAEKA